MRTWVPLLALAIAGCGGGGSSSFPYQELSKPARTTFPKPPANAVVFSRQDGADEQALTAALLAEVEEVIAWEGADQIAVLIAEPVQNSGAETRATVPPCCPPSTMTNTSRRALSGGVKPTNHACASGFSFSADPVFAATGNFSSLNA